MNKPILNKLVLTKNDLNLALKVLSYVITLRNLIYMCILEIVNYKTYTLFVGYKNIYTNQNWKYKK